MDYLALTIEKDNPEAIPLLRVVNGNPSTIYRKLKSNGSLMTINPNGVTFVANAVLDFEENLETSTLDIEPQGTISVKDKLFRATTDAVELEAHGNVYVLAIRKEGVIRASKPLKKAPQILWDDKEVSPPLIIDGANRK